jgi:hypothetical protein
MFQRETRESYPLYGKFLSRSLSSFSARSSFASFWRLACISHLGTCVHLGNQVYPAAAEYAVWGRGDARGDVRRSSEATVTESEQDCAEKLARFFPHASRVRIPVQVMALRAGSTKLREATVLEFGAAEHAIFLSTLPLEFDDRVRIERDRNGCTADAAVVAVQYHEGRKAVAVRFLQGPCAWVTQP